MRIANKRYFRTRKYLTTLLFSIIALIVLLLSANSWLQYSRAKSAFVDQQERSNRKVFSQINYNISYMKEIVDNLIMSLYFNDDVTPLLYSRESSILEVSSKERQLDQVVNSTSFLHSIVVYNENKDRIYIGGAPALDDADSPFYQRMLQLVRETDDLPRLKLIPVTIDPQDPQIEFFSQAMYESLQGYRPMESALILNVKSEWLFDNIELLNQLGTSDSSIIFLMDGNRKPILPKHATAAQQELAGLVAQQAATAEQDGGTFRVTLGRQDFVVTYGDTDLSGWKVYSAQLYDSVTAGIDRMRTTSLVLTAVFLLLSVAGSFLVARRLYKPIGRLVGEIRQTYGEADDELSQDELSFVGNAYKRVAQSLTVAKKEQETKRGPLRAYYVRKLLTESRLLREDEAETYIRENQLRFAPDSMLRIGIIKIDRLKKLGADSGFDSRLFYFAVSNIAEEIVSVQFPVECLEQEDHLVILLDVTRSAEWKKLQEALQLVQQTVHCYYKFTVTVAVSDAFHGYRELAGKYGETLHYSLYRVIFEPGAVITSEKVQPNLSNRDHTLSPAYEKRLIEAFRSADIDQFGDCLRKILEHISTFPYDYIALSVLYVVTLLKNTCREINSSRFEAGSHELEQLSQHITQLETLEDMRAEIVHTVSRMHRQEPQPEDARSLLLVETITQIVEQQYVDYNLSLQQIADMLRLSSGYVGRMFRASKGLSVAEYINEVRLIKAAGLLENSAFSITEIMEKVGCGNQGYFFKLFKKKYGLTPKEYRTNKLQENA